jgi:YD repeat-containing protein
MSGEDAVTHLSDRTQWKLRGPVRTMRSEIAERDYARSDWEPARFSRFVVFDEHGRVVQLDGPGEGESIQRIVYSYDADGRLQKVEHGKAGEKPQVTQLYTYDSDGRPAGILQIDADGTEHTTDTWRYADDGRKTHIQYLPPVLRADIAMAYGVEGGEFAYGGGEGATRLTTHFDPRGHVVEALFHDDKNVLLRRIVRTYDQNGNLQLEEAQMLDGVDLSTFHDMTAEDREKMLSLVAVVASGMRTEYHYDAAGRVASRTQRMGMLGEDHATYTYDDHGNPLEESRRSVSREIDLAEGDTLQPSDDKVQTHQTQFTYTYDSHGNWTERVVSWRHDETEEYRPSNVERRAFEYF